MVRPVSRSRRARDIDAAIGSMDVKQLYCRDFGHAWEPWTAHAIRGGGYEQVLRCARCTTRRSRLLDRRGEPVRSGYDYADGYLIAGLGRLTGTDKGAVRIASIQHMIESHPGARDDA